ncbi:cilia- and flagella-associated protein 184 [Gouania willdenowi]|uniref:CCDC113/CCDC96 coiled-coil domain-containing protein n=1 Tax=Gouania willdenowi TaxID=441366 RepID=A0A8C5EGP8_GOUWI|nr:coiled-coil domain-containing protein 96 [Gouania willdenowi]
MDTETGNLEDSVRGTSEVDFITKQMNNDGANELEASEHTVSMEAGKEELFDEKVTTSIVLTSDDDGVKMDEVTDKTLLPLEDSVVFEINSSYNQETSRLNLDTPEAENQEEGGGGGGASEEETEDLNLEEYLQVLQQLQEQREKAIQHSSRQQRKLAEYLCKKNGGDSRLEEDQPVAQQQQHYEKYISVLSELKQQIQAESDMAQQEAEELRVQSQERLHQVEDEWRALAALKREVCVSVLSRRVGREAAEDRVHKALMAEQLQQDQVNGLRLKSIQLQMKIHRLEEELGDDDEKDRDPLLIQFEKLQTERLERKRLEEKQNEEVSKLQKKILSSLEIISYTKNNLQRSKMEVQTKKKQLAELEAEVERRREHLSKTKQVSNNLHRHNGRLKEQRGLLGNRLLLQDFEDTVDASEYLEEQLESLKSRHAEVYRGRRCWKNE